MRTKLAIIGGGPAGLMCAITAKRNNENIDITIFEKNDIAHTLLPTGGGRCNLSYFENDIKTFAQNYPRGEKFLYSVFNKFFTYDTIDFFSSIGIKTYIQEDNRIFPESNKSLDVIFALKNEIQKLGIIVKHAEITSVKTENNKFIINEEIFDATVVSTGGRKTELITSLKEFGHTIIEQKPALCGLEIKEKIFAEISGVSLKQINTKVVFNDENKNIKDDILFTHKGISGPLSYKISSLFSQKNYSSENPIFIYLNFTGEKNFKLQKLLETNSKKKISSIFYEFMPKSMAKTILNGIPFAEKFCHQINKEERKILEKLLSELKLTVIAPLKEGEIVSSGGVALNEINSTTMESKLVPKLFFCGEVMDIDGFCGGFNLQNCWSTGYIAGKNIA